MKKRKPGMSQLRLLRQADKPEKRREEKRRQDKTRQDKTRQDKTRQR
jgi:hypothetical protein